MSKTKIAWVRNPDGTQGKSFNPVTGCYPVSPECANCFARRFAERWRDIPGHPYEQGFDLKLHPERLDQPGRWRKPTTVFVCSMSDLFHQSIPRGYRAQIFDVMEANPQHTFQCLTKRASEMRNRVNEHWWGLQVPRNIWFGVTVGVRASLHRVDDLRATPTAVRFLSLEPLLEDLGELDLTGIHWVICGGESGPGCRPMDPAWARNIRDQCVAAGVPFFYKQGSGRTAAERGNTLDGETWNQMPERAPLRDAGNTDAGGNHDRACPCCGKDHGLHGRLEYESTYRIWCSWCHFMATCSPEHAERLRASFGLWPEPEAIRADQPDK